MSFSMSAVARDKIHAKDLVHRQSVRLAGPGRRLPDGGDRQPAEATESRPRVIRISAVGHLCDSSGSYSQSTAQLEVTPIEITR
jgi:hypothetical protein